MDQDLRREIKFGTDGWRGVISDNFTFKNVRIVAQAIADWVNKDTQAKDGKKRVAVAYDARFLGREYAELVSQVLAGNGIEVYLSIDAVPTPALSYGVVHIKGVAGIMITASHNPGKFNGIKIKTDQGGGAGKNITNKVEEYLGQTPIHEKSLSEAKNAGLLVAHDFKIAYLKFMKSYVNLAKIRQSKFKILQDVMHGSGGVILREVLKGSKIKLEVIRDEVNPSFEGGKPEPVPEYLKIIMSRMKKEKFDLGHVLDGDADRIAAVSPGGEFISPQKILGLIILHLARNRGRQGGVVKTLCSTTMIDKIANKLHLKLYETPVGFKHISDLMVSEKIIAGGEEAGGIGVQDYIPERDGTLAGLLLLEMMVYQKKNIKQLIDLMEKEFGRYYYVRADLDFDIKKFNMTRVKEVKNLLGGKVVKIQDFDGIKLTCENENWLMLRPSGTEPLVRTYSEAKSLKEANKLIEAGKDLLKNML